MPGGAVCRMAVVTRNSADHDLLVRLDTKLDLVSIQFNEVRAQMVGKADHTLVDLRITKVEERVEDKADQQLLDTRFGRLETKVDALMRNMWMITGGLIVIELALRFLLK